MAQNDAGERTEEATPKRRQESREKGQLARSRDLTSAIGLVAGVLGLMWIGGALGKRMMFAMQASLDRPRSAIENLDGALRELSGVLVDLLWPFFGLLAVMFLLTIAGSGLVGGFNFSFKAAAPKWSKLSPLAGFKRMFGMQALVELVKSLAKFLVIAITAALLLKAVFAEVLALSQRPVVAASIEGLQLLLWLCLGLCMAYLLIVLVDVPYQIWHHNKQLKMTKQEVKDEYKDTEGKPEVKGRIRQLQRQMAQRRQLAQVPQADVIITNPTHYAVALRYDQDKDGAPVMLAKGVDHMAAHIRDIAEAHDIPMLRSPGLARSLYHCAEPDQPIPDGLFVAVAQVLAYVFQLKLWRSGKGTRPKRLPGELPIPPELRH
ncbi:flagellar biosynthesis protein FlhB [Gallaecimonas sp. GXIMD4217]|uniref:flagellar biosynthesis protein FlhB n=1 Tax=Gallaecimonas sp. GXIMD4217 TaxID=3131927 RepID=UPI00311AEFD7